MASISVNIPDMLAAIKDGTVPGKFGPDRKVFTFPQVDSVTSRGKTQHWVVSVQLLNERDVPIVIEDSMLSSPVVQLPGRVAGIATSSWQEDGKVRAGTIPTIVTRGKNLGKSNATNVITQALRDALGLYNKQLKHATKQDAPPPPMLVKKLGETRAATLSLSDADAGLIVQRKYNGVRAVCRLVGGKVEFYSRTGGNYSGLAHLMKQMHDLFTRAAELVPGRPISFDGELYKHGKPLQYISGIARGSETGGELDYVIYDCFFPDDIAQNIDMLCIERQKLLRKIMGGRKLSNVKLADNFSVRRESAATQEELDTLLDNYSKRFVREGYEGAIVRKANAGYQYGTKNYHSSNLVKIKPIHDEEFPVVGFSQGTRGKDVGALIWICESNGTKFNVVPKNISYAERKKLFACLEKAPERFEKIRGKPLTVEFPEKSSAGVPVQAKALGFRDYEPSAADKGKMVDTMSLI